MLNKHKTGQQSGVDKFICNKDVNFDLSIWETADNKNCASIQWSWKDKRSHPIRRQHRTGLASCVSVADWDQGPVGCQPHALTTDSVTAGL